MEVQQLPFATGKGWKATGRRLSTLEQIKLAAVKVGMNERIQEDLICFDYVGLMCGPVLVLILRCI